MNKKKYYLFRTLKITGLVIVCSVIAYQLIMLKSTANDIKYQQTEKFSYSLINLASAEATRFIFEKRKKDLRLLTEHLSHDPLIRDTTIYDRLGKILYQSGDVLPLDELLNISEEKVQEYQGAVPYMSELYKDDTKLGYIRITLEQDKILSLINDYRGRSVLTMILLVIFSFSAGIIISLLFLEKIKAGCYFIIRILNKFREKNLN